MCWIGQICKKKPRRVKEIQVCKKQPSSVTLEIKTSSCCIRKWPSMFVKPARVTKLTKIGSSWLARIYKLKEELKNDSSKNVKIIKDMKTSFTTIFHTARILLPLQE
jgi:hypothetical protein